MDLDSVAHELYGLDPANFTSTRNARATEARKAGDRALADQIKALKRPSAAAWSLNQYARANPEEVHGLARVADDLRQAQASLSADQIRELSRTRQQLLAAAAEQVRAQFADRGQRLTDGVMREIEDTLDAAAADPEASAALRSGRLVRSLSYAGFGPVDLLGAIAAPVVNRPPPEGHPPTSAAGISESETARQQERAIEAAEAARSAAEDAEARRSDARAQLGEAAARTTAAEKEIQDLESALDLARRRVERARADLARAERESSEADADWAMAVSLADEKAAELRNLRSGSRDRSDSQIID